MAIEKERKLNWLIEPRRIPWYWGLLGILCICPAGFFVGFYDSPLSGDRMGVFDYVLIYSVISFPIICIGSSVGLRFLNDKNKKLAFYVALLPLFPLLLIFAVFTWANVSSQDNALNSAACVFDGGDGLDTTLCETAKIEPNLDYSSFGQQATTSSALEAHSWQFSAQQGKQITILMETYGRGCPAIRMRILDSRGIVIEGFDHPSPIQCASGTITDSTHIFDPPADGIYTLRLDTPETPGPYWFNIAEAEK